MTILTGVCSLLCDGAIQFRASEKDTEWGPEGNAGEKGSMGSMESVPVGSNGTETISCDVDGVVDSILEMYKLYGEQDYIGEEMSIVAHSVATADEAFANTSDLQIVVAAFLHDIGHLLGFMISLPQMGVYGTVQHEVVGANYLARLGFPRNLTMLVQEHVNAKRYRVTKDPEYKQSLSDASRHTLDEWQGGEMDFMEAYLYSQDPMLPVYLEFRRWEDASKDRTYYDNVPRLGDAVAFYIALAKRVLTDSIAQLLTEKRVRCMRYSPPYLNVMFECTRRICFSV